MKKRYYWFSSLAIFVLSASMAAGNGLNLNGLGSRAVAMGGAYVALADDFSAIFWNPAGIALIRQNTAGAYLTDLIPSASYELGIDTPFGPIALRAKTDPKHYPAGMASFYHPVTDSLVAGIAFYTPSGLGANWDGADFALISNNSTYIWNSLVYMATVSPALAYKFNDQVMLGAALNINYANFDISTHAGIREIPLGAGQVLEIDLGQQEVDLTGWGYGITFGILVKPSAKISLGATFRTSSSMTVEGDARISNFPAINVPETSDLSAEITWPLWFAAGVAFNPIDRFTLTTDIQFTNWDEIDVISFDFTDPVWAVATANTRSAEMRMRWRNATQLRFGVEYRFNRMALRGGYYWDPSPAPDETMNVLLPNFDFHGFTAGFGYTASRLQIDVALEYLKAKERNIPIDISGEQDSMPGIYSMSILVPNISLSYRW